MNASRVRKPIKSIKPIFKGANKKSSDVKVVHFKDDSKNSPSFKKIAQKNPLDLKFSSMPNEKSSDVKEEKFVKFKNNSNNRYLFQKMPSVLEKILYPESHSSLKKVLNTKSLSSRTSKPSPPIMIENQHVATYYPCNHDPADRIFVNSLRPDLKRPYAIRIKTI